jgi:hypothetical protein
MREICTSGLTRGQQPQNESPAVLLYEPEWFSSSPGAPRPAFAVRLPRCAPVQRGPTLPSSAADAATPQTALPGSEKDDSLRVPRSPPVARPQQIERNVLRNAHRAALEIALEQFDNIASACLS